jgi:hypothetical protein
MQIISGITRQTSQSAKQAAGTVGNLVKLSEQLVDALSQFRSNGQPASGPATSAERREPALAEARR